MEYNIYVQRYDNINPQNNQGGVVIKLIIDRYEGDIAVLVGDDGKTCEVRASDIPFAAREGDCVELSDDGTLIALPDETKARAERVNKLLEKIKKREIKK